MKGKYLVSIFLAAVLAAGTLTGCGGPSAAGASAAEGPAQRTDTVVIAMDPNSEPAAGFDPAFGCQFSTYAVPKIAGEIRRFLRDDGAVKVSRGIKERGMTIRLARDKLGHMLGRDPTLSELSEETGLEPEDIAAAEEANLPVASLQMETGDGFTLESVLGTEGMEEAIVEREALRGAVAALPERERQVILLRYFRGMTQDRTAKVLGVSQVQVSRIERKAVEHLRRKLE